jgi:hypothetical protein
VTRKKKAPRPTGLAAIVPTDNYEAQVSAGLTREERDTLEAFLAAAPEQVPMAQGLGGARKVRWALSDARRGKGEAQAKGKRGGARVVYFYRRASHTVYLLDAYLKGEKEDLSAEDKREIARAIQVIEAEAATKQIPVEPIVPPPAGGEAPSVGPNPDDSRDLHEEAP